MERSVARRPKTPKWLEAARARGAEHKPDWLARALARAGAMPVKDAEAAVVAGRVKVDGKVVKAPFAPVDAQSVVQVDGVRVDVAPVTRVVAFHKPAGVVTADHDPEGMGTVFDALARALPPDLQRFGLHAVGRLDRDTTGLLLFTNDERFVAHATAPASHLPKRYVARVSGLPTEDKLAQLRAGLALDDGMTRPAEAELRGDGRVALTLTEGRNHQVKRMLGKVGLPVLALHREAVGTLVLDVPEGACRLVSPAEIAAHLAYMPRTGI